VSREAEESPLLEAATKQHLVKMATKQRLLKAVIDQDLAFAMAIYRLLSSVEVLE
jgi:hypothetical protein